ncbi:MAG: hypothetical protein ACI8RZ_005699 [Myxococcota bacterium]|jgi:hypothetical protein
MIWLISTALAGPLDRYPRMAPVSLSDGAGVWRVDVPPLLRSPEDPEDGTDLLLIDAAGEPVEIAMARGRGSAESVTVRVAMRPSPDTLDVRLSDPIDRLEVQLESSAAAATVTVFQQTGSGWVPVSAPTLIWEHSQGQQRMVELLGTTSGELRIQLTHHHRRASVRIKGWRDPSPAVQPDSLTLPVVDRQLGEDGLARYIVELPAPMPIERISLTVEETLFDRQVGIMQDGYNRDLGTIRRLRIGGASVEHLDVPMDGTWHGDRLELTVESHGAAPLNVTAVTVWMEGLELLLVDPEGGPFSLYGGADPQDPLPSDLNFAVPELFREAQGVALTGSVIDNPAYLPPEVRSGLAAPSTIIDLRDYSTMRTVDGIGLVRIPLDEGVLVGAQQDLSDLRLVDGEGRQIPYLHERRAVDARWSGLEVVREEDGSTTRLKVTLPEPEIPISSITLSTEATLFSRRVTAWRARGIALEPLRSYEWGGADRPGTLTLELSALIGETLVITIENDDDPPMPVTVSAVGWPRHELIAVLPDGGARLVYGNPGVDSPAYDLSLLSSDLRRRATGTAILGAEETLKPPPASMWDRLALGSGLGAVVLGLLWLTMRLVRAVEETPLPEETTPEPDATA